MSRIQKKTSINNSMLSFILFCWAIPLLLCCFMASTSYYSRIIEKEEELLIEELKNVASFSAIHMADAITLSQRPSYEKTLENAWKEFAAGKLPLEEYLQEVHTELKGKFYLNEKFNMYAFYRYGETEAECYSSTTTSSFKSYKQDIEPRLRQIFESDSSYVHIKVVNGRIFIVRNLYTITDYERYGTLVIELNKHQVFKDVKADFKDDLLLCIGDREGVFNLGDTAQQEIEDREYLKGQLFDHYYDGVSNDVLVKLQDRTYNAYLYQSKQADYHIAVMVFVKRSELYAGLYGFYFVVVGILVCLIPIFYFGGMFLRRHIQKPMDRMMEAYRRMEEGEIGIVVEGGDMPNAEFQYMKESFDSMSAQVKYLFDYVYDEKLARKDAQIQALQAQINPHFLNNTLEMMNWQVRMSGNVEVSKMIESLGTVLDYRMNRADVKEILLAEELQCIDAYFYIMSMRFGQRLSISREVDDSLLYIMVPPLIFQPLVENAIIHGVEAVKNAEIKIKIYHDEEKVYMEVQNTGKPLSEEGKERIRALLNDEDYQIKQAPGKHTSIGIRNVNRRIHLVYGEEYGLTITQDDNLLTTSRITIPYVNSVEDKSIKERTEVEQELKEVSKQKRKGKAEQ